MSGVPLLLEVVAELVENSRRVLSAEVRFQSLLDCLLYSTHLGFVCVLLARRLGKVVAFYENKHHPTFYPFECIIMTPLSSPDFVETPVLAVTSTA